MPRILGLSAFYHDSAACLLTDGRITAAAQEERFTRKKHDAVFPAQAVAFCLKQAGLTARDMDAVVFYEKPFPKFERLLETYLAFAPRGFRSFAAAMPNWVRDKLFLKSMLVKHLKDSIDADIDWTGKLLFSEHHLSHAASAFYPSPFQRAAVLTLDGVGEWPTASQAVGNGSALKIEREIHFPHSLGLLYSAFTTFCGFKVNSGEYKLMGLAPYGTPRFAKSIRDNLIQICGDGSFHLNMRYFDFATGLRMTNDRFAKLFGGPARTPEAALTQREMDLAASVQAVTEEIILRLAKETRARTGEAALCLSGGVALNCVANGALIREGVFDDVWIQPAAGDAGGALGAALAVHHQHFQQDRPKPQKDAMHGGYLGPAYTDAEIAAMLTRVGAQFKTLPQDAIIARTADHLADGQAVGWMQGRMEFGPRALGARSILADPRAKDMQKRLNLIIKKREGFRPFAPSVLAEQAAHWFDLSVDSPYMLVTAPVADTQTLPLDADELSLTGLAKLSPARSTIPAVTHVNLSARVQTVHHDTNPTYHALLTAFFEKTGCPVLVNTSFNVRGEPVICTPSDAWRCFMTTDLDVLVIGNCILLKSEQTTTLDQSEDVTHELD